MNTSSSSALRELALTCILVSVAFYVGVFVIQKVVSLIRDASNPKRSRKTSKEKKKKKENGSASLPQQEENEAEHEEKDNDVVIEDDEEEEEEEAKEEGKIFNWGETLNQRIPEQFRSDHFIAQTIVILMAIGLAFFFLRIVTLPPTKGIMEEALHETDNEKDSGLGVAHLFRNSPIRYFLYVAFVNINHKHVPLVSCQYYPAIDKVHTELLGPRRTTAVRPVAFPPAVRSVGDLATIEVSTERQLVSEFGVDTVRERTRGMCVLEEAVIANVDHHEQNHEPHVKRPMFWELLTFPAGWYAEAPITAAIVTERGQRHYRVMMVHESKEVKNTYILGPVIVAEQNLLDAAHNWYFAMQVAIRQSNTRIQEDEPCLCAAHLGILGSGVYFAYDSATGTWSIELHTTVTRNLTQPHRGSSLDAYSDHLPFPYDVDRRYGIGEVNHFGRVRVTYLDPVALFETPAGRAEVQADLSPDRTNDALHLASIVPLQPVFDNPNSVAIRRRELLEFDNACYHHCWAIEESIAHKAGVAASERLIVF